MTPRVIVTSATDRAPTELIGVVEAAVRATLRNAGVDQGEVSVTLLDDAAMASMNERWKERTGPTDVLAFSLYEEGQPVVGDVYLSVERAAAQADEHDQSVARELARLAVHGTLHVLGWDHPEDRREESEMWQRQERIVAELEVE
jgi:probable rRNA maturation factor